MQQLEVLSAFQTSSTTNDELCTAKVGRLGNRSHIFNPCSLNVFRIKLNFFCWNWSCVFTLLCPVKVCCSHSQEFDLIGSWYSCNSISSVDRSLELFPFIHNFNHIRNRLSIDQPTNSWNDILAKATCGSNNLTIVMRFYQLLSQLSNAITVGVVEWGRVGEVDFVNARVLFDLFNLLSTRSSMHKNIDLRVL